MRHVALFILLAVLGLVITNSGRATLPYNVEEENRFSELENEKRLLKLPYSFSDTNASASDTITLGESIPADSIITDVAVYVDAVIVSASDNTLSLGCETASDLFSARDFTDLSANDTTTDSAAVTGYSSAVYSSDGCDPTWTVGSGYSGITSGRPIAIIEYLQPEEQ
jgi:hypothetical protein